MAMAMASSASTSDIEIHSHLGSKTFDQNAPKTKISELSKPSTHSISNQNHNNPLLLTRTQTETETETKNKKKKHKKLPFFSPTDVLHTFKNTRSSISPCFYLGLCFLSNTLMAENQSSGRDPKTAAATTFSQLLFSADHDEYDEIDVDKHHHVHHQIFEYSVSSSFAIENPPKMLCFGTKQEQEHPQLGLRSAHACSDSVKRKNGSNPETTAIKPAPLSNQKASKKTKPEAPCSAGHAKRKEKLGERITALQQLVSPFGKTDTASVLHEAMGYIKFLHEQIQVLYSPYLDKNQLGRGNGETEGEMKGRGLCLIPVECSLHLANCTVADFWSPAMAMGRKL
ncbi:transcription factor bHLH113 isoform X1 [Cucurbita maxima]|uniref:Transcription factor bHLH113 isoform X1 n=1 Tax=Cucurbita maxima TaxID=3661 RepID=A0A6J1IBJ7_CUCMA|nr:transcription factor bHLH113 isoform X1 [Cucurbita maxima]